MWPSSRPHSSVCSAPLHAQAANVLNVLDKMAQSVQSRAMTMLGELWQAPSLIRLWSRRTISFVMKGRALAGRELPEAAA